MYTPMADAEGYYALDGANCAEGFLTNGYCVLDKAGGAEGFLTNEFYARDKAGGWGAASAEDHEYGLREEARRRWAGRPPARFRERVAALFTAAANAAYLRGVLGRRLAGEPGPVLDYALDGLDGRLRAFARGRGGELVQSDPLAQRGDARPGDEAWAAVRRLNRAFVDYVVRLVADVRGTLLEGAAEIDGAYHVQAFIADSLRPPGLEHLNDGVLHATLEEGAAEGFASDAYGCAPAGEGGRSAAAAVAELFGEGAVGSDALCFPARRPAGATWKEAGATRFMRYPEVPFWQAFRSRPHETDIDETLGAQTLEMGCHVRGWDMARMRDPAARTYRARGWTHGETV